VSPASFTSIYAAYSENLPTLLLLCDCFVCFLFFGSENDLTVCLVARHELGTMEAMVKQQVSAHQDHTAQGKVCNQTNVQTKPCLDKALQICIAAVLLQDIMVLQANQQMPVSQTNSALVEVLIVFHAHIIQPVKVRLKYLFLLIP
jgi:hypothetical protein